MTEMKPDRCVTAAEARDLLPELESSGLSVAAFARERGLVCWPLYNARRAARVKSGAKNRAAFAEVSVVAPRGVDAMRGSSDRLELVLPSGLALRLPDDFDEVTLRRLLGTLAAC